MGVLCYRLVRAAMNRARLEEEINECKKHNVNSVVSV